MAKYPGRELEFLTGAPPGGNSVGQVTAIGAAGSSRALIDASAYGDDWKDYVLGQQDGDELTLTIAYDPADNDHEGLVTTYDGGESSTFQLLHADSGFHVQFPALITALSRGADRDGLLQLNATLKILTPGVEDVAS